MRRSLVYVCVTSLLLLSSAPASERIPQPGTKPPANHLGRPLPGGESPSLPVPEPPSPVAIDVNVRNFPLDEEGRLSMCDHTGRPRDVQVVNPQVPFQLVGFTSETAMPDVGVFGLSRTCQAEFTDSRMCSLAEALGTVDLPSLDFSTGEAAWVRDEARPSATCQGWSSKEGNGLVITAQGSVIVQPCAEPARVACCAAVL